MANSLREFVRPSENVVFVSDLLKTAKLQEATAFLGGAAAATTTSSSRAAANLYEKVRERQRCIENEQWNVDAKKRQLEQLEEDAAACCRRHELRAKRLRLDEAARLRGEIERLESGAKLAEFQLAAQPYLKEYQKQQFCRDRDDDVGFSAATKETAVVEDFVTNVEAQPPKFHILNGDVCPVCAEALQLHQTLSMLICPKCGSARPFLDATASLLAYSDDYDSSNFSYKRISHFEEFITHLQGKESADIPAAVLEQVMQRLADERVTEATDVTVSRVREVLKKLKLRKYYENVTLITSKITGRPAPKMTPEMEERMKVCFLAASAAFQRHIHAFENRKNMISYATVTCKLCEMLGYVEFLPYFAPLKSPEKLAKADECWRMICADLGWPFFPSLP
jgi:hypothetical protein